jgi:predicted dehydrogenase
MFPNIRVYDRLVSSDHDAFVIATPIHTHFEIAKFFLEQGKHVLIQKPMSDTEDKCVQLNAIAKDQNLTIMVAHTFLFSPAIQRIKYDIDMETYGPLDYISSTRINLGLFQRSHNVVWDLAPHDFSILLYLYNRCPKFVSACGTYHTQSKLIDCANITVGYDNQFIAMINLNWLSPIKVRNIIVAGKKKMAVYDDCSSERLKIYDSGVDDGDVFAYRKGDVFIPRLDDTEAILNECQSFVNSIIVGNNPLSNGYMGQLVVRMIEATCRSIQEKGKTIEL